MIFPTATTILLSLVPLMQQGSEATVLFAGDAMMHQKQIDVARQSDDSYDYSGCFGNIAPLVSEADYAVVNLETPVAGGRYSGFPCFNAPDSYVDALKDAGFDMFLTANNHILDRHDAGLIRTVDILDIKDVDHIGTYRNSAQRDSVMPMIKDINGFKVGFLNYTFSTNGIEISGDVVVDYIDRQKISADIKRTRQAGAELICVAVHWGVEYKLLPHYTQISLADYLVDQGVELVIGGHPHVIQPMEMRTGPDGTRHLVIYSLGNFISDMKTTDTRGGAVLRAFLKRDDKGRAYVDGADYDLVFTIPGTLGGDNFRLVYTDSCDSQRWYSACRLFETSATNIFRKHNKEIDRRPRPIFGVNR